MSLAFGISILVLVALLTIGSCVFFSKRQDAWALRLLAAAAVSLRVFVARLDPFLHDWDEQFHALVAKNTMHHWLKPMIRVEPLFPFDYRSWCCNEVWLHKQPLFLWQMALSMKIFGVSELAMRLPSVLLGAVLVWPIYRIGKLVFNRSVGYYAAMLHTFAYFQLELTSGWMGMDHNDVAFMVYITASIWAYYEYRAATRKQWQWALLVGVFVGFAVLCKWLVGLSVYAGWGLGILLNPERRQQLLEYKRMAASVALAVLIVLPWEIYTSLRYPLESSYEREFAARHFFEVIEGHGGKWWFYLAQLPLQYGWLQPLLAAGIILALTRYRRQPVLPLLSICLIVYVFFSIAQTKLWAFTYIVAPLLLIMAALAVTELLHLLKRLGSAGRVVQPALVAVLVLLSLKPDKLWEAHRESFEAMLTNDERQSVQARNAVLYRQLNDLIPPDCVAFNVVDDVKSMFYADRILYNFIPSPEQVQQVQARGKCVVIFPARQGQVLPDYLLNNPSVRVLWAQLE